MLSRGYGAEDMSERICQECKEGMWPDDPSKPFYVGFGTRLKGVSSLSGCLPSLCSGCSNYPSIWGEIKPPESRPIEKMDKLPQLQGQINYNQNRLDEHLTKTKKKTYTIE